MGKKSSSADKLPKVKCCVSKDKCGRCPLRMLKEGTLPEEYAVKRRRLVHADSAKPVTKDELKRAGKKGARVVVVASGKKKSKKSGRKGSRLPAAA
ncbi:hypothetical protein [Nocardioides sp. CFH 31398]|uniref:hypothetical protein n=1 Tax=Nocardioides sp. CFH 31398 TaxID=2919579 RepID=UPI001F05D3DC|nr:hypothetical protein [Nocardioides sp. CFH 31398]MCH1868852.1 hypothetical protein [Nocardioides sp. CFH 31398]